jgi:hypothetical protein
MFQRHADVIGLATWAQTVAFIAAKYVAFLDRGDGDYYASHDLEGWKRTSGSAASRSSFDETTIPEVIREHLRPPQPETGRAP